MLLRDDADCSHRAAPIHDQPPFKTGLPLIELSSFNMRNDFFLFLDIICMRNLTCGIGVFILYILSVYRVKISTFSHEKTLQL